MLVRIRVSMEHLTSNVLCAPSPGIITANLQGKDWPLECPRNSQKQPIRPTHAAKRSKKGTGEKGPRKDFLLSFLVGDLSPPSYQPLSCLRAGAKFCLYTSQCKVSLQEMSTE